MIQFFAGFLIATIIWFVKFLKKDGTSGMTAYNDKLYQKDWKGLKEYLEEKAWNLCVETEEWKKEAKKLLEKTQNKTNKRKISHYLNGARYQEAKILFITGILQEFWNEKELSKKIWDIKKWKLSKSGNKIIKK